MLKDIKHHFMAMRNGIVSDTLRKAGQPYGVIFGLQLPQLAAIAREYGHDNTLADALWEDAGVRESRLLACYIYDPSAVTMEKAMSLLRNVKTREEADILSFRLLQRLPFAEQLAAEIEPENAYAAEAIRRFLN